MDSSSGCALPGQVRSGNSLPGQVKYRSALPGQGTILMIAAILLVTITAVSISIMNMSSSNVKTTIVTEKNLQTYYIAQAGIQEALATRMIPRSNYLNYVTPTATTDVPFLPKSGKVYADPANSKQLMGMYRYIIVGGDPARDPGTGNYYDKTDPNLLNTSPNQNFYIVSKGTVCRGNDGLVGIDVISIDPVKHAPVCAQGYTPDEITLMSAENLSRTLPNYPGMDVVADFKTFQTSQNIPLDTPVFVPGSGLSSTMDFEAAWAASGTSPNLPVIPTEVLVYRISDTVPNQVVPIVPGQTTIIPNPLGNRDIVRILFSGGVDYRSLLVPPVQGYNVSTCINPGSNPPQCSIQIWDVTDNQAYNSNTIIPNFPSSTQVIILPPSTADASFGSASQTKVYQIRISGSVADYNGNTLGNPVVIQFKA